MNYFLLVVLPNLREVFLVFGGLLLFVGIILLGIFLHLISESYRTEDRKEANRFKNISYIVFFISILLFLLSCFIPSKQDLIVLKVIGVVHELEGSQQIPQKLLDKLNNILDEK